MLDHQNQVFSNNINDELVNQLNEAYANEEREYISTQHLTPQTPPNNQDKQTAQPLNWKLKTLITLLVISIAVLAASVVKDRQQMQQLQTAQMQQIEREIELLKQQKQQIETEIMSKIKNPHVNTSQPVDKPVLDEPKVDNLALISLGAKTLPAYTTDPPFKFIWQLSKYELNANCILDPLSSVCWPLTAKSSVGLTLAKTAEISSIDVFFYRRQVMAYGYHAYKIWANDELELIGISTPQTPLKINPPIKATKLLFKFSGPKNMCVYQIKINGKFI